MSADDYDAQYNITVHKMQRCDIKRAKPANKLCCLCVPFKSRGHNAVNDTPPPHAAVARTSRQIMELSCSCSHHPVANICSNPFYSQTMYSKPTYISTCKKINSYPKKVILFPEEGWARSASSSYWTLTPYWWTKNRCKIVEVTGTKRYSTQARVIGHGSEALFILGSFKRMTNDCDFKLYLTTNITTSDYNMGYLMTGNLERGSKKTNSYQMTHFAVVCRRDC